MISMDYYGKLKHNGKINNSHTTAKSYKIIYLGKRWGEKMMHIIHIFAFNFRSFPVDSHFPKGYVYICICRIWYINKFECNLFIGALRPEMKPQLHLNYL